MAAYRRIYTEEGGYSLSEPYPGVEDLLHALADAGVRMAISTSKVGAGWGYGLPGELAEAGAVRVYASADEVRAALLD